MTEIELQIMLLQMDIKDEIAEFIADPNTVKYSFHTGNYLTNAPKKRGVYFVWEGNEFVYVGEGGDLTKRMKDIKQGNHPLIKHKDVGMDLFNPTRNFRIAFYPLRLGRIEMEETFASDIEAGRAFRPRPKYNKKFHRTWN
ncbi:hypothetical protein [Priestia megaterium]|uniref:hypothetical protein n=1 Tax=Priestia megaterium TaxID=1404 RepID=UPI002877E140|nr:hypothetical protein [Priestia megaterium]